MNENGTIYWPSDISETHGCIIGWISEDNAVVAGIIPEIEEVDLVGLTKELGISAYSKEWNEVVEISGAVPSVIGNVSRRSTIATAPDIVIGDKSIECYRVIRYRRPRSMHYFYSMYALNLDVTASERSSSLTSSKHLSTRLEQLYELDPSKPTIPASSLARVLSQINVAFECHQIMSSMFNGRRNSNRQVLRPMLRAKDAMGRYIGFLSRPLRSLSALISSTCNVPLPGAYRGDTLLKDISATVQQVDVRTEQSIILPQQFKLIQYRNKKEAPATVSHYISFYNCIWLILNDVIIGSAVGAFLYENSDVLGQLVANRVQLYSVQSIQETLLWLDNWPVGLKLNTQLSRFFCSLFMGITNIWGGLLLFLYPYFPHVVAFVGISGRFGVTMILSLFSDFLSFSTAHLYVCYIFATVVVSQCLSMSGSLWRLFRGKRRNVLRNRTDSWDYDIDQLLLGTILFTLLTFLFPTVLVYYSLFVLTRLAVIFIHAGLETCLSFMNHFPLFAMMLRLKDPSRLPGGIYFVCSQTGQLELKNQPIPFSHIFFQYIRVWSKVSAHYDPRRLLRCIFTASFITPIQRYKIRYAMISSTSLEREERIES